MNKPQFQKVIVTSGPTREWIDPVRYISNASSGKMGFHFAVEALKYSPEVVYIVGGAEEKYQNPNGTRIRKVSTTKEMLNAVLEEISDHSLLVMAAAPADYRPANPATQKIKKSTDRADNSSGFILEMEENPDILKSVAERKRKQEWNHLRVLGFAAETNDLEKNAKAKMIRKNLDWIAANLVSGELGFGEVESTIYLFTQSGESYQFGPGTKEVLAAKVLEKITSL
jgi:phosphopantothenoylcysteine decarboxylase/phosphopantothenate--cysteine ligase